MKVYYLSSSAFSDNQMNTLKYLSNEHKITYAVIIPHTNSNFTKSELDEYCITHNIDFVPFELEHRFRNPRLIFSFLPILQSIRKVKPDLVYFANFDQIYLNAILLALDPATTIIALHDVESHSGTAFNRFVGLSKSLLISRFRHFHTYSSIQQRVLRAKAVGKSVYNISLPLLDFGPPQLTPHTDDHFNFLFFGNILPYKGLDLLIPAFKRVAADHPNARLTIAGRCQDWGENYADLIQDFPQIVPHIRFIDNAEIPGFFSMADYVVLPYRDTTQSGPLMIAYNYNVPVLVSDAEGFAEFISEGVTGYCFRLHEAGDMERVLRGCIEASESDYFALKEKLAAYTRANYSPEALVSKYSSMFDEVIATR